MNDVTLRVASDTLTPPEISQRLGLEPERTFLRGERMSHRNPLSAIRSRHLWLLTIPAEGASVEAHLHAACELVRLYRDRFHALADTCTFDAIVAWEVPPQLGFEVSVDQMRILADSGIGLTFSLYGGD